jgi:lipid A disaccharide synthetase
MSSSTAPALRLFVIAGEESGDRLGGALMAAVKGLAPGPVAFHGIGGLAMAAQGLDSLFPLHDIAVNGFSAILVRVPYLLRRIREAVDAVIAAKPDVLVIIDSPGFTHRVARQVRARAPHIPIVDYVSPQMWVWRSGRAATMRAYVDHVLALLPFEPEAHRRLGGPPCTFVGHPLAEDVATLRPDPAWRLLRTLSNQRQHPRIRDPKPHNLSRMPAYHDPISCCRSEPIANQAGKQVWREPEFQRDRLRDAILPGISDHFECTGPFVAHLTLSRNP